MKYSGASDFPIISATTQIWYFRNLHVARLAILWNVENYIRILSPQEFLAMFIIEKKTNNLQGDNRN